MTALLDIDQLRTFIAIAETGSFTKAAEVVNKTQSAVSMQMKRLEERLERADLRARRPRLQADRGRLAPARLRAPAGQAQRRDGRRLFRRRAVGPRAARRAGRLRRPLSARDHGALLARLSGRRADRAVRAFGRPGRPHRRQRSRPRHHHQLRIAAHRRDLPARAPAVGDARTGTRPISRSRCRSRSGGRAATGGARRSSGWNWSAGPTACSIRARMPARSPPRCSPASRCRCCPNSGLRPGMRVLSAAEGFPELPACHIGLVRNARDSLGARRRARRPHHLLARQPVGSAQAAE